MGSFYVATESDEFDCDLEDCVLLGKAVRCSLGVRREVVQTNMSHSVEQEASELGVYEGCMDHRKFFPEEKLACRRTRRGAT